MSEEQKDTQNPHAPKNLIELIKRFSTKLNVEGFDGIEEMSKFSVAEMTPETLSMMDIPELKMYVYAVAVQVDNLRDLMQLGTDRDMDLVKAVSSLDRNSKILRTMLNELDADRLKTTVTLKQENQDLKKALFDLAEHLRVDVEQIPSLKAILQPPVDQSPSEPEQPPKPKDRGFSND